MLDDEDSHHSWRGWSTEELVGLLALSSALLYGALFLGYHSYYSKLGLAPEDVGVNNTYILVRSPGFVVLALMLAYVHAIGIGLLGPPAATIGGRVGQVVLAVLMLLSYAFLVLTLIPSPRVALAFWLAFAASVFAFRRRAENIEVLWLGVGLSILLSVAVVVTRGNDLAEQALDGLTVTPYRVAGVPTLDVSADRVCLTWLGPKAQRPASFGGSASMDGLYIGDAAGITIIVKSGVPLHILPQETTLMRLPTSHLVIEQVPEDTGCPTD